MRRVLPLGLLAAVVLAGSAAAGGPPGLPQGVTLQPPITLPTPAAGKGVVERSVITGVLKPGVTKPYFLPLGYGPPPATIRVASGETKPTVVNGHWKVVVYWAIGNIAKRQASAVSGGGVTVSFNYIPQQWQTPPTPDYREDPGFKAAMHCHNVKVLLRQLFKRVIFGQPGDQAAAMWIEELQKENC